MTTTAPAFVWLVRPRRVLLLLTAIWVLNAFDLAYTMTEADRNGFVEMNPVAANLLDQPAMLIGYKFALVIFGSVLLLVTATSSTAEYACWFLLAAYCYVGVRWSIYYADLMPAAIDPFLDLAPL